MEEDFDYKKALKTTNVKTGAIAKHVGKSVATVINWRSDKENAPKPSKGDILLLKQILTPYLND